MIFLAGVCVILQIVTGRVMNTLLIHTEAPEELGDRKETSPF